MSDIGEARRRIVQGMRAAKTVERKFRVAGRGLLRRAGDAPAGGGERAREETGAVAEAKAK